jgi:putative ATPase
MYDKSSWLRLLSVDSQTAFFQELCPMTNAPLAERVRPLTLDDLVGQDHLTGPGSILRVSIERGTLPSMILWGPSGTGKTTLAGIIAHTTGRPFFALSAISAGVKEIREVIEAARAAGGALLFIDEIHRFNKGQQDALLGAVEKGVITLIGATTENPSFEVNSALLSRCQVFVLRSLEKDGLLRLISQAMKKDAWLAKVAPELRETEALMSLSGGDGRKLLNLLELAILSAEGDHPGVTDDLVMRAAQRKVALYDKKGEQHYDIISAFIKSIRGSDPNAALYWMARMIEGGEEVRFIARRLVILASEDIGNANPTALVLANATFDAVDRIGWPEARIILAQCAVYLASSPKSNASYLGIDLALAEVRRSGDLPVPMHIRNAPTKLMKDMGYGREYKYAHDYEQNFAQQEFLPEQIAGRKFYEPGRNQREEELRRFLRDRWKEKYGY